MSDVKVKRIFARKGLEEVCISKDEVKEKLDAGWDVGVELSINGKFCGLYVGKDGVEFVPWGDISLKYYFEKNKETILKKIFDSRVVKLIVC